MTLQQGDINKAAIMGVLLVKDKDRIGLLQLQEELTECASREAFKNRLKVDIFSEGKHTPDYLDCYCNEIVSRALSNIKLRLASGMFD